MPNPPYGWKPAREAGESDQAAIERFNDALTWPDDNDAPKGWEP